MVTKAFVRKDLIQLELGVPVGNIYYFNSEPLLCRWIKDIFQVLVDKRWLNSESIDWDFQ
ncbi:MAG: hypothetical protein Q7K55_03980 [Candidatus Levybacteria bacterium]|nr:hypothetical protein [Candidatus Levybacteria bacterium]